MHNLEIKYIELFIMLDKIDVKCSHPILERKFYNYFRQMAINGMIFRQAPECTNLYRQSLILKGLM